MLISVGRKNFILALGLFFCWAGATYPAEAAVHINEIAWMGTLQSPTNEWIELYNDTSSAVDLSRWKIEAVTGSPIISLSGAISSTGYFLIERTDDSSVPAVKADLVASFGTGLSNSGETLLLKNATGTIIDTVIGGTGWVNIGGNNTTKETAQRTESGWITGVPTPRAPNIRPQMTETVSPVVPSTIAQPVLKSEKTIGSIKSLPSEVHVSSKSFDIAGKIPMRPGTTTVLWKGSEASSGAIGFLAGRNGEWFFLCVGIVLSLFAALIIARSGRREISPSDEYAIIEDIIEGADD